MGCSQSLVDNGGVAESEAVTLAHSSRGRLCGFVFGAEGRNLLGKNGVRTVLF